MPCCTISVNMKVILKYYEKQVQHFLGNDSGIVQWKHCFGLKNFTISNNLIILSCLIVYSKDSNTNVFVFLYLAFVNLS